MYAINKRQAGSQAAIASKLAPTGIVLGSRVSKAPAKKSPAISGAIKGAAVML
ncbi:hypothetical protein D3C80_2057870 [compost metagenome]|jgi:hypothetical protein